MNRAKVRQLKRAVSRQYDADAAYALLQRSVHFGHKRLALLRCVQAERMGIAVAPEILSYCRRVADEMSAETLQELLQRANTPFEPLKTVKHVTDKTVNERKHNG